MQKLSRLDPAQNSLAQDMRFSQNKTGLEHHGHDTRYSHERWAPLVRQIRLHYLYAMS